MKKIIGITFGMIMLTSIGLKAQHDVRVNFIGLLFKNYGIGYEFIINDEMGAGLSFSYSQSLLGLDTKDYSSLNITPDFRFYTNPEDGADGFYFGGYLNYAKVNLDNLSINLDTKTQDAYGNTIYADVPYNYTLTGFAIGLELGRKWVTNSGVFFETNFGFGRYLTTSHSYSDSRVEDYFKTTESVGFEEGIDWLYTFDYRLGLSIGYRFGQ